MVDSVFRRASLTPLGWGSACKIDPLTVAVRLPFWKRTGGWGMKGVDTIARIRREFFVRGRTIKEIVRDLHVSRNTVRKVLRSGATEFSYEREVQPRPKLGAWTGELERILTANETKAARERLTLIRGNCSRGWFQRVWAGGWNSVAAILRMVSKAGCPAIRAVLVTDL